MKKVLIALMFVVIAVLAGLGGWWTAQALAQRIHNEQAAERLGEIQRAVEAYAVDHDGSYPAALADVLERLPDNPYADGAMPVLAAGDAPVSGGVVYLPAGTRVAGDGESGGPRMEYSSYALLVYGPKGSNKAQEAQTARGKLGGELTQVDLERVIAVLDGGG